MITMTGPAISRIKDLIKEENNPDMKLRVYITGGGCSGFQYGFDFAQDKNDGDLEQWYDGVGLLVDPMSFQYLMGSEIDFEQGLMGARFKINNPMAKSTCGCGSSFTI